MSIEQGLFHINKHTGITHIFVVSFSYFLFLLILKLLPRFLLSLILKEIVMPARGLPSNTKDIVHMLLFYRWELINKTS